MKTIVITPVKLTKQTPTEIDYSFLELGETHIRYTVRMMADEPKNHDDDSLGVENNLIMFDWYAPKVNISSIDKKWNIDSKKWFLLIAISGAANDMKMFFKMESKCDEVLNDLLIYMEWK